MENNLLIGLVKGIWDKGKYHYFIKPKSIYFYEEDWKSGDIIKIKGKELIFIGGRYPRLYALIERFCENIPPQYTYLVLTNPEHNQATFKMKMWKRSELERVDVNHKFSKRCVPSNKLVENVRKIEEEYDCMVDWNALITRKAYNFYREKGK